jgi:hypothetical protein
VSRLRLIRTLTEKDCHGNSCGYDLFMRLLAHDLSIESPRDSTRAEVKGILVLEPSNKIGELLLSRVAAVRGTMVGLRMRRISP